MTMVCQLPWRYSFQRKRYAAMRLYLAIYLQIPAADSVPPEPQANVTASVTIMSLSRNYAYLGAVVGVGVQLHVGECR